MMDTLYTRRESLCANQQALFGTLAGLEFLSTALRLYTRRFLTVGQWMLEDYLIIIATVSLFCDGC